LAKNGLQEKHSSGAKARLILLPLLARLKPCPYYKALSMEFLGKL
jgi:hypothetical protein